MGFVWEHFNQRNVKGKSEFFCKYCNEKYSDKNVSKKRKHILKCENCPKAIKNQVMRSYESLESSSYVKSRIKEVESPIRATKSPGKKITVVKAQPQMVFERFSPAKINAFDSVSIII